MNPNIAELITRYRGRGAVVDTNLFLVLLLGNVDPRLIGNTARTDGSIQPNLRPAYQAIKSKSELGEFQK